MESNPADLLNLLHKNKIYNFGSGIWFLTTQCSADMRSTLQDGSEAGWERYITDYIKTTVTDKRKKYWEQAVKALGIKSA